MNAFQSADILLPQYCNLESWAVIACDQFTSEPEYWARVHERVGDSPSALHLVLPEAELKQDTEERIRSIRETMRTYEDEKRFSCLRDSFVYVERELTDGTVRRGLVGKLDLEQYDYSPHAKTSVRATERTVVERIPPRMKIREGASLELPHVLLLCDDREDAILSPLRKRQEKPLYDFDLMEDGGHIRGWQISGSEAEAVSQRLSAYEWEQRLRWQDFTGEPMLYAAGDGNHSLATAKACYEKLKEKIGTEAAKRHPARYALAELGNLHDPSLRFEPIHRLVSGTDPEELLQAAEAAISAKSGSAVRWFSGGQSGEIRLDTEKGSLPVGILQDFLDAYLRDHPGETDYIHGEESLLSLAQVPGSIGFLLPPIEKNAFFQSIMKDGVLPRKTFSMGQARDKRYYLEARKILL